MADEVKETKNDGEKLCAYKLLSALGTNGVGDVIHVPESVGEGLVTAGLAEMATADDMGGEEEGAEEYADSPVVANSIDKLTKKIEQKAAETVAKELGKTKIEQKAAVTVPATVREPIYKSTGAYIKDLMLLVLNPSDTVKQNKAMAYQQEAAKAWNKLGVQVKTPLGINETTNSQGGYLVNPQFSPDVYAIPHGQVDLQSMVGETIDAKSNVYNQRFVNESSLANGSIFGGLNMVATAEGASLTSSLPAWSNVAFTLAKLAIFSYFTSEVLEDASYPVEKELDEYVKKAFIYGINTQIVQGSTLEGFLNAPSLVTVTSSSNDTAWHTTPSTALTYADLANIWASVYPDCQTSAKGMWLFHPSLANPLTQMTYTFSGSNPAWGIQYDAQDGLVGRGPTTPYRIFGKPAYPCWAMSAPGTAGDIMYVDMDTVKLYRKPFRVEVSKDYQFGTDQVAVRFISRLDCKTVFRHAVTGPNGTQQFSNLVTRSASGT